MSIVSLNSDKLSAKISSHGAELQSLKTSGGHELLWQADPHYWARHAPHLFPIVGRLKDDTLRLGEKNYHLAQHGFARDMSFIEEEVGTSHVVHLLKENADTLQKYPFKFELRITHRLLNNELQITYNVFNPDKSDLWCSIGTHPGFAWPLLPGLAKEDHYLLFASDEDPTVSKLDNGLAKNAKYQVPVRDKKIHLHEDLFKEGAFFYDKLNSRSLSYTAPGAPTIHLKFPGFPHLGIWSKDNAPFICLEPWQGYSSPEGFDDDFTKKPGVIIVPAGEGKTWEFIIQVE